MDRSVSSKFFAEIQKSHRAYSYVDVVSPTQQTVRLDITDGKVTVDRTAAIRRTCTATCVDRFGTLTPEDVFSILTPYGTVILPYRGVIYPGTGEVEAVPLGVFRVSKVTVSDTLQGLTLGLDAYDLSRTVARDKFTTPVIISPDTLVTDAIQSILAATFPHLTYNMQGSSRTVTTQLVYDVGSDPWQSAQELATSLGCDIYFDSRGVVVVAPPTDIAALPSPDFSYVEGKDCTLLSAQRIFTDEPGYNGVVVTGETPTSDAPPVRAVAWDTDPGSVTNHTGAYGEVPKFVTDSLIKTTQDAQDTANQLLRNELGFASQLGIDTVVNPAYECGDVIQVTRAKSHIDDIFSLDAFVVPLGATDKQSLVLRQKRRTVNL